MRPRRGAPGNRGTFRSPDPRHPPLSAAPRPRPKTMHRTACLFLLLALLLCLPGSAIAWYPRLAAQGTVAELVPGAVIGADRSYVVGPGETLMEIARRAGLGYQALAAANPGVDPWFPEVGHELVLPFAALLPPEIGPGITINLAEYRLYLAQREKGGWRVRIYPVGLGRQGWETPEGDYTIVNKVADPTWTPPDSLRAEKPELPAAVLPGPDNPLGGFWLGLSAPGVGLHGTNQPYGVGRRVSHGCIRLYPDDIADLAGRVAVGTPVRIVYRPVKAARRGDRLLLEVHPDFLERFPDPAAALAEAARRACWPQRLPAAIKAPATGRVTVIPLPPSRHLAQQAGN
jgi:L,D-transpeptidase ErfK/SrfK